MNARAVRAETQALEVLPLEHYHSPGEWDALVRRDPSASFCHSSSWREIMTDVLGHETHYLAAVNDEGGLAGALPLVRVRSRLFGHFLVSMPFLNYGGPVGTPAARFALTAEAVALARRSGAGLLELRSRHALGVGLDVSARKVTVTLPLPDSGEKLWAGFRSKLRSQIRRPMKEGYEVRSGPAQLGAFYDVFARTMRELGTPVLPRRLFERIAATFPDEASFSAVFAGEVPVAAGCGFFWAGEFELTWAGALREYGRSAPNMLLYWAAMERAVARGTDVFNFGRCSPGAGTHRFKLQWGGSDEPLPWTTWSPHGIRATPSPAGRRYRVATHVWRQLPLAMTNHLGPRLARLIP